MEELKPFLLLVSLQAGIVVHAWGQPREDWVAVTNVSNPSPPTPAYESAADLRVDPFGNVYVTGSTMENDPPHYTDIMTIKYAPDGTQLWAATYDGPMGYDDRGAALRVDSVGNVYVTGVSEADLVTLKYNPNGNLLWLDRYNSGAFSTGRRIEIAPDGGIYVMGGVKYAASDPIDNYLTIRYLPDGTRDWVRLSDNGIVTAVASFRKDDPVAMAVDSASNVYVTGTSSGGIPTYDNVRTVKYSPSGSLLWNVSHAPPGTDAAVATVLSPDGRLYVAGDNPVLNPAAGRTYLIQYDPATGLQVWIRILSQGIVSFIAPDPSGNICLTGGTYLPAWPSQGMDWWTVLVDSSGSLLWTAIYQGNGVSGEDAAFQVLADPQGSFYVVGMRSAAPLTTPDEDIVTIKYGPTGQALWTEVYDYDREWASRIVLGGIGEFYLTGTRATPNPYGGPGAEGRAVTIKYSEPCPGSAFAYGSGCPGSGGLTTSYQVLGCPTPLNGLTFHVTGGLGGALAILGFGLAQASIPLPGGCLLLIDPLLPFFFPVGLNASGAGTVSLQVPAGTSGAVMTTQAFVLDGGVPQGFSNTNGLQVSIH